MKIHTQLPLSPVTVHLSAQQLSFFQRFADGHDADIGSVLVALASDRLDSNPLGDAALFVRAIMWEYAAKREIPTLDSEWLDGMSKADKQLLLVGEPA